MDNLLPFIIKSSISMAVLYGYYDMVLKRTTNYEINRFYLLFSVIFSVTIPFISINIGRPEVYTQEPGIVNILLDEIRVVGNYNAVLDIGTIAMIVLATIYSIGVLALSLKLIYGIYSIRHLIKKHDKSRENDFHIIKLTGLNTSFTFFRFIFIGEGKTTDEKDIEKIKTHERVHAEQLHSIDIIVAEIATILLWMNPLIWLLRKAIKDNHEYIADNEVIKKYPAGSYLQLLLNQTTKANISYGNCFAYSNLKKRMAMISKKTSGKYSLMSYIPAVLTALALFIGFSCSDQVTEQAEEKITSLDQIEPGTIKSITLKKEQGKVIITDKNGNTIELKMEDVFTEEQLKNMKSAKMTPPPPPSGGASTYGDEEVFVVVENMPKFPGGIEALTKFISKNVNYPKEAQKKQIEGRVFVGFIIDKEGNVTNAKVLRPVNPLLDAEAIRVVEAMPKWKPGTQRGKAVRVSYTIPIKFALK